MTHILMQTHCRKVDLVHRGWTRRMIDKYLGEPDTTSPWNYNRVCWYDLVRVDEVEQLPEIRDALSHTLERRAKLRAAAAERQKERKKALVRQERERREARRLVRREELERERQDAVNPK
jgi:hypothetical protein